MDLNIVNYFFLDARPTPEEQEVWEVVNTVLENSSKVLENLRNYKGASDEIREVIIIIIQGFLSFFLNNVHKEY